MNNFLWTEEHTVDALKNLEHSTWADINPPDMLRTVERIQQKGGKISQEEFAQLSDEFGGTNVENFRGALRYLRLLKKNEEDGTYELTQKQDYFGFYSGEELAGVIKDVEIISPQALNILGHNFIFHAREALPFCCSLMEPGVPKDYLKREFENHYVFNQKLNEFKFENLIKNLINFKIIKEVMSYIVLEHSPLALIFYQIASSYLFLASNKVDHKVDAGDLQREVYNLLPNLEEKYSVLGFDRHPIEGWGKNLAWMTSESFTRLLRLGLIDPLCIARVLQQIVQDIRNPSNMLAKSALRQLKKKILDDVKKFKGDPINLPEILQEYEVLDATC